MPCFAVFATPHEERMRRALLSDREEEVATLIADELADKEIAQILQISVPTVRSHLKNISQKLDTSLDRSKHLRRAIRIWVEERDRVLAQSSVSTIARAS